jgi:enamine deaminase RidA (YjgF/YER057c/UK114 family)
MELTSLTERAAACGLTIPAAPPPIGLYAPVAVHGITAYTSGVVGLIGPPWEVVLPGEVGTDLTLDEAQESARAAMLTTLANLAAAGLGERVERVVRLTGYIRCAASFGRAPTALDGASRVLADLFGEHLLPARTALPVPMLPGGASVEIETVVALRG